MPAQHRGSRAPGRLPAPSRSLVALALVAAVSLFYLALPHAAESQINGRVISPPKLASGASQPRATPALPSAPVQVELPPPPPMRYVPGMAEPLVATGPVGEQESRDLDAALKQFHDAPAKVGRGGDFSDYAKPLLAFMAAHPQSNWNAALHVNLGFGYYYAGYYSRAFPEYEAAWRLGRNAPSPQAHLLIDRAVGELARMHARVGHGKELDALFADIGKRPIGGPGAQTIAGAHEARAIFSSQPGLAYLCGPVALRNVLAALKASPKQIKVAAEARSGPHGFTLSELGKLADKAKLKYRLIYRTAGEPVPVPSIINWNVHHYAAIVAGQGGMYALNDPTFGEGSGGELTQKAIDAEGSGYFLVPASVIAANPKSGWRTVSANSDEARAVYGMGVVTNNTPQCTMCTDIGTAGQPPREPGHPLDTGAGKHCGDQMPPPPPMIPAQTIPPALPDEPGHCPIKQGPMTVASSTPMVVSLHLQDTPVGYLPQIGLPNQDTVSYNSREAEQPANFSFSNLSANWSHDWQAYVKDDPTSSSYTPTRIAPSGGGYYYYGQNCSSSTGICNSETPDASQVTRTPATGTIVSWNRALPDGSKEVYGLSNGATTYPRFLFLTQITDPRGNATTINYDASFRITSIVDAMGRSTSFTYGLAGYPLLITKITDPFGRTAQFTYDTSERLSSITDPIGITSSFTYSATEPTFVTQLTTPYGNSIFSDAVNPNDVPQTQTTSRSLTLTDPLGYTDYVYFYENASVTPASDPADTVPDMSGITNQLLQWRNTYYWNRHAWGACVAAGGCSMTGGVVQSEDFTKAALTHWYHWASSSGYAYSQISSVKQPLENRFWFANYGTYADLENGTLDQPIGTGRVLDDGTSQVSTATYPHSAPNGGYALAPWPLTVIDPLNRENQYTYASNHIDLLTVQQKTSASGFTTIGTYGSYNTQHEPQTYTGADGQIWHYAYNTVGQISTITDPNSGVTTYNYDSTGRLSTIQDANLVTVLTLTYDSADRVQTRTDSQGYVLTYGYDNLDRITSITYPDTTTDLYDYTFQSGPLMGTPSLELRKHTDRLGRITTYAYDADQRLTSVTESVTATTTRTTSYDYYEDGTLEDIIDANGNDTHYTIDIESRPITKTYAYGTASAQTETYAYENTTSRLHSITDALGQVKTLSYAKDNRISGITYTSSVNTTPNVTFAWDTYYPRMTSMVDGLGTTSYSYTAVGTDGALKLSSVQGPFTNNTIGLTYDALGRLAGRTITGGNETFGYDAISRLNSHVTPLGSFTIGYLGQTGQSTSQSVTNGSTTVSTTWGYDTNTNDRRLISIANSGVTRSYTLGYGSGPVNVYDIMSITDTAAAGHPWATQSRGYTYDEIDRLLTASSTTPGNDTYAYDKLDNATTYNVPGTSTSPTYNGLNQLHTFGTKTYAYDADGNTLSGDGTRTYKWDAENRLIEIDYVGSSAKSDFSYDGVGHRAVDVETASGGGTTTTRYLWCGSTICQTRNGSDTVLRRDLPEGEYNVSSGQKLIYMPDQLGSVRDVLDGTSGSLVQSYDYTPYGAVARNNGTTPTDYQYAGLFHHVSGLNLSATRPMDGGTGRWIGRDPLRELVSPNLYAYVKANPTNWLDLTGLSLTLPPTGPVDSTLPPTDPLKQLPSQAASSSLFPASPPFSSPPNRCTGDGNNQTSASSWMNAPFEVAGTNWDAIASQMDIDPYQFSDALHAYKEHNGLGPADNMQFNPRTGQGRFNGVPLNGTIYDFLP